MLKTLVLTLSILAIVGIAFVSADDEQKVKIKADAITGKIVSVEMEKKAITLRDATTGENVIYVFNDTTTFYRDGNVIEVKTLVPDEEVTLKLDTAGKEKNIILRLDTPIVVVEEEKKD
ncbi:hypothetical protein L0222_09040 [bacterium]|nr:hypothetical protein [bacterium]MCI0603304.1 hypothetical protein [bacterium]